uniref:ATP-dependent Clp protease proteolytic subunit n=1 Tax=Chloropicon laureae TaxID=464258 RepID=A0A7S3DYX8_9CHLO|mmetsp:Transcript_22535/g.47458  ORF Transcript_22535/g.47458 Transcript_22535/m.47458 type:complete len:273 (-) Transcript_22535:189-1007(-)
MRTAAVGARGSRGAAALASASGGQSGHNPASTLAFGGGAGRQQQQQRYGARPSSFSLRGRGASLERPSKRVVATRVIPSLIGDANTQPPPDLPSFLFKERIVYLGMTLVPSVTELLVAELLYLQFEDPQKPIYFYINSTGTTKQGDKMAYDAEAFAIYDTLSYVKNPVYTVCVGTAWGEAAMLLAAGEKGHRAALPSSTIMIKEPIATKRGQASDLDLARLELREVREEVVKTLAKHTERTIEQVSEDIKRPIYMKPEKAIEYGIIDKVMDE